MKPRVIWIAGCDVVPLDRSIFLPFRDGIAGQFGSIVSGDRTGITLLPIGWCQTNANQSPQGVDTLT